MHWTRFQSCHWRINWDWLDVSLRSGAKLCLKRIESLAHKWCLKDPLCLFLFWATWIRSGTPKVVCDWSGWATNLMTSLPQKYKAYQVSYGPKMIVWYIRVMTSQLLKQFFLVGGQAINGVKSFAIGYIAFVILIWRKILVLISVAVVVK